MKPKPIIRADGYSVKKKLLERMGWQTADWNPNFWIRRCCIGDERIEFENAALETDVALGMAVAESGKTLRQLLEEIHY